MSDQREAILAAMQRRAESVREPASGGLPEVDEPESWPHAFASFREARGFVHRLRESGSKEARVIAEEYGVSTRTVRRAVASALLACGEYDPESWLDFQRRRKAEGRQRFLGYCRERDREKKATVAALAQTRSAAEEQRRVSDMDIEELLAASELHVPTPVHSPSPTRLTRGEKQRRLNARTRRFAGA